MLRSFPWPLYPSILSPLPAAGSEQHRLYMKPRVRDFDLFIQVTFFQRFQHAQVLYQVLRSWGRDVLAVSSRLSIEIDSSTQPLVGQWTQRIRFL